MATWITVKTSRYIHRKVSAIYGTEESYLSSPHLSGFWKFYLQLWNHNVFAHFSSDKFLCVLVFVYPTLEFPEHDQKRFDQRNIVYLNSCLKSFPATLEGRPINSYDLDRALFWKSCNGKKMHQLLHRTWWGMILKGIFLSHTLKQLCCKVLALIFWKASFFGMWDLQFINSLYQQKNSTKPCLRNNESFGHIM